MAIAATLADSNGPVYMGTVKTERYTLSSTAPTVTAKSGAGTATAGTATIAGAVAGAASDFSGRLTITTGTTTVAGTSTLCTVNFGNTMAGTPSPIISPAGVNAATLFAGTAAPWVVPTTTGFDIQCGSAAPLTAYSIDYSVPDAYTNVAITQRYLTGTDLYAIGEGCSVVAQSFAGGTATIGIRPSFTTASLRLCSPTG